MKKILTLAAAMFAALTPAFADDLAITPATLPDGMEGVPYNQTLFVEGGDQSSYQWREVHASWTTAACSYQVSANETPLWEGRKSSGNVEYALPFAFPFAGKTYDKVYVGTHGFLFFKNASVDQTYPYNSDLYYYTGVAPFWCDTSNVEGYVDASVANEVSFRFESFSTGTGTWAARVTLKSDGTIRYAYRQDGNTFNSDRTIGVGFSECGDYAYVGDVTDGIPTTDIVFETYGLPAGLQLNENYYWDSDKGVYGSVLSGMLSEACDVRFAVRASTNYVGIATNFYSFSIVRNPNRPPVIDAFAPADTNAVIFLDLGDTATFNVAVTDEAGDPFDVKWEFLSRGNSYYSTPETVGTETNLVFEATQALYEMQNSDYQPLLRCTVSDECWTNTVTWKVNIRRDWHVDAAADPGTADGSADHPWPIPHTGGLQRGDTVFVAPGTYVWGPSDSTQIGIAGGVTFRSTGSAADTKFVFQKKGYIQARYYKNSTFQGFSFDGICFYNCYLVDCEIRNYDSADSYDGAIRGCSLLRCYVTGGTGKFHCYQTDIVDSTIAGNTISVPSTESSSARAVGEECSLTRSIVVNNLALDGVEANVYTDTTYSPTVVTNSCTIPAMTKLGPGNYEAQPTFVSLAGGDLRLRVGSACIDLGDPANNPGAYKGPGVEGFVVHAFTDPVRGIFSDGSELQIVASGATAYVMVKPLTDRAFLGWVTNGVEVAGVTTPELAIENIDCDYEVEALFEYREFWVNPTETDDSGDGTAAAPKKTVAAAAALALDGETVNLAEGTYEPFALMESPKVTLLGKGPDKTFIDGGGTNWCVRLGSNATLKNVAVVNGSHPQSSWYDYAGGVTGGTIENCVVSNCVSTRSAGGVANATVVSCLITGNSNTNEWSGYAGGLYHCKVYNSTIVGNIRLNSNVSGAESCYLFNNIITGNKSNGGSDTYDVYDPKNANFSSSISSNVAYSANLIGSDPWFVDAANGDYRLIAGSPAIDAGGEVFVFDFEHATDLAGERRIRNGVIDYGCYEGGVVTAKPAAPVATGMSAKAAKGIPFTWEFVPNAAVYRIYRGTSDNVAAATLIGTTTATSYLDLTTTGGTDYFYWISAYANDEFGESAKCGPIAVTSYADLKIETASLPAATEAIPYSVQLECSGNVGAATWSLPYAAVTRGEGSTFNGDVGVVIGDDWPETDTSYQHNPIVTLPFTFTWFGEQYDKVRLSKFGALYFGVGTGVSVSWSTSAIDDEPKITVNEGPYSSYYYVETSEFRVDSQPDHVTIVWKGTCHGKTVEFSATLNSDNTVRLAYGSNEVGAYVAFSNGSADTVNTLYRAEGDFSNADDFIITCLPNESNLTLSEDGLLSGIEDFAGSYKVSALVTDTDNGDTVYKTFTLTVNANANTRPVIDSTSPATGGSSAPEDIARVVIPAGDSQAFSVAARDPEGAALHYDWYLDDAPVSSAGASWTYAPAQSDIGRHSLVCEVSDSLWTNGQVYAEWDISVGQKLYVNAVTGTTNGTGTAESPFKTLQQAEEWLSMGATVLVAPGTYAPVRLWGWTDASVVFRATGSAAETIIDGGGSNVCVDDWNCTKEFTFIGFTLRNGGDTGVTGGATGTASYGVNLRDCVITGCTGGRCTIYGADVEDCTIYGNTATRYGAAVGFCNVVNSLIYGNTAGGTGVVYRSTLDHCTVYGNTAMVGGGLDATSTADHSIVWGNTATADASTANYEAGAQFTVSCTTPLPAGDGNIAQNPQFVDAAGGDFRLADGSPCKEPDMGYSATGVVPVGTTYTVTFDANGGTPATTTRTVAKGKAVGTLPTATRAGYTLDGWYTAKSGGTKISASTTVTKDVTYYARWNEIPTYTVTFDANGGTCATKTMKVAQGEAVGELPEATRDGFKLAGWFTAKTGGSLVTEATTVTKNITYYARWTEYYELVIDENGVLTGLTGTTPATIDVPATVTGFAADLFKGVAKITAATGGANVTKCGAGAFRDSGIWKAAPNGPVVVCGVLVGYKGTVPATVDVPNGVRVIADGAFAGATSLATVYLPDSLVSIGAGAFKDCTKLDDVFGLEDGVTVAADAFEGTLRTTFRFTWSGLVVTGFKGPLPAALVLPAKVIGVGVGVFKDQATLTSLVIEGTNTVNLGSSAFEGCANLATVTVGGSPTIAATTFKDCTALQTLTAGGSASIAASAFQTCTALKTFTAGGGATVGASAFEDCTTLETFTAGDTVSIATNAFKGCVALANTDFGEVSELGAGAFEGCSLLASLELAEGIEEIGAATFKDCASLGQINLPASVTTIGASAFEGCTNLVTITGGDNVRILRTDAFAGTAWYDTAPAGAFEEVILGHVLLRVKGDVPASYEISTNVTMVANGAFAGVTTLTELYIGTEVVSLWDRAFAGCTSLGSVTIPSGCREFGDYLFEDCISLTNVFFRGHAPTNDIPHVFAGTPETLKVRIKEGSRGWEYPGSESDFRPVRWPYMTTGRYGWQLVANDLNRAVSEPEEVPGVVRSIIVDGTITNDTTWVGGRVYEIQRSCSVKGNATLTVEAGAIVKLPFGRVYAYDPRGLNVSDSGSLVVNGTLANPVVFTSIRDDSWGGDTNGDGNRSEPYPSECGGVYVYSGKATVHATYAKFLYGQAVNSFGATACLMSFGRASTLYGCEFSHSAMDGYFGCGRLENCVFTDCDRGLVSVERGVVAVNCVAYGNRIGFFSHTSYMYITNCISAFNSEYGISGDGNAVFSTRSCLWTPGGENTRYKNGGKSWNTYNVDNIEADPLFLDAENGDFRISVESPCVDAAYGEVAPMNDFYEQPRMDVKYVRNTGSPNAAGEYPDIGIYEVPGTTERPVMNLEVESVSFAPASAAPGETLTVTYTVRNTGNTAAKGSIRDVVRIKSAANGGTMVAGTVTQIYNLEPSASVELTASVAMPSAPAGEWLVGIDVNPNRDVFEQNFLKNSLWTEDAVEVTLQEMTAGSVWSANVPAGTTMGYILADVPAEGGVVVITESGGHGVTALPVVARVAAGHMPTAVMNDATSFVRADGAVVIVVPAHPVGDQVYLAIENTGISAETVNVSVQALTTELWSVYPLSAANVGDMGFTFTGAGLKADSGYYLGNIPAKSVTVLDSANVFAVFDVQNIPADRYYDVKAAGITIRDAIRIDKVAKGPILDAKLELPERTRDNRVYTGYVVYENKGDTQMNAPTFIINIAEASSTNTVIGAYDDDDDNLTLQRVLIVGLGSSHPAGVLKPGDSGRLPFKFKPVGSYQFKLDSRYTSDEVADAVTRMNLRGGPVRFDGYSARGLANLAKKGETAAAVSGYLLDVRTREPLAKAALKLAHADDASFARVVTTDDDGYFQFEQLKDGTYSLVADTGYTLVTTNLITVAGQTDINGYEATALPPGTVSGYVIGDDGSVVQYGSVTLFKSQNDMTGETVQTDGYGAYRFTGLEDGEYSVYARPVGAFKGVLATNAVVSAAARDLRVDFTLPQTTRAYGTVTLWKGVADGTGEVRFYREDGNYLRAEVSTNGMWEAVGLEPGEYSATYVSADGTFESGFAEVALAKGDETEIPLQAIPATPFELSTTFGVIDGATYKDLTVYFAATGYASDTNVASVVWDFGDGSGTFETNAVETAHVYTSTGLFSVSVTPRYEDGTLGDEFVLHNCLCITNELETIYKANAIVLGGYATQDADDRKDAGTLVVTGVGEDWVTLTGAPGAVPLAAGTVIAGPCKDENGEDDWILRKIVGVTGDETSGWRLATEHGNEEDLYEQYWFYGSAGVEEKAPTRGGRAASPKGGRNLLSLSSIGEGAANLLKKTSGSIEKGIEFEVDCSPDLHYHYSCKITSNDWRQVWKTFRREDVLVWENLGPRRRELHIWGDVSLKADITATAEFKGGWEDEQEYELVPKAVSTLPSAAKAIPYFKIGYSASGTVSGEATATAEVKGHLNVGFVKESDKKIQWYKTKPFDGDVEVSFDADEGVDAAVKLAASVSAGFGVKVKAFEVVSASADVTFNATAAIECPKNSPSKASASIGYDTNISMNFIDLSWLNKDWKVGMDWSIEGPTLWSVEWISAKPKFIYRQPHAKEWPARITVTDRSERGTFADARGRTFPIPIESVTWDYGQGQSYSYNKAQIDSGEYKKHRIIEFPADQEEGEYVVSLNVQGGIAPSLWPCQKKIKIKKPKEDEVEEQSKIFKDEWFGPHQDTQTSVDPNEMAGPKGVGEQRYVKPGEPMTYTIYFENKADAAIAAQEVFVDNALSEYLDWSTFEMGTVSVGGQIINGLDGYTPADIALAGGTAATEIDQTNGLYKTRVELQYDATEGIASWYIRVVDPVKRAANDGQCWPDDPDAGVLQPNIVSPEGEGYITYSVCVREDAPANTIIDNSANIVFDQNAAIVTDPAWWNTVTGSDVGFADAELEADEGDSVKVKVMGGNIDKASSVQLYLTYNTAASADLDLAKGEIDGEMPKGGLKFPLTLSWAKGEIGARTVTIPVKTDKTVEGDEFFTLQLAAPNGLTLGDATVCTVTIHDTTVAAGKETLQDAVNNAVVKMSTAGKGKWAYSSVGTGDESEPGKTASASAASPALKVGETADLKAGAVKGSGTLTFDVRVANDALEGESPESPEGAAKTVLTLFDGKVALLAWTNETDWTSASYTVEEAKATSHAFTWQVVQGADTNARAYVANVAWSPADTDMRAITLSVEPAEGGAAAGSGVYPDKTKLSLVATAKVGYEFIGWYDGEMLFDAKAKPSVTITNDLALTARFEKIPYVRGLADPADGGKVTGSGLCARGKKVTLKAAANKNFTFLGWRQATGNGEQGTGNGFVATTPSLVIDRTAKPAASSKTSMTITNVAEDVTYYAVFKSDPEIFVTVDATDGTGAEPTGKGAGKYVAGTITGMGKYAIGKTKIALKATANKGYVFSGWYDAYGELLTKDAAYTIAAMGEDDVEYTAKFITAAEDKASIALALTMAAEAEALGLSTNEIVSITNFCGVAMNWQLAANALSATTIKVAGLPSGLKFTAKDIMKKGSKTEVDIPANTIYGAPTAASKTDKNGNVTPSKVVFTVTTAGKSTQTFAISLYIDPLPAWAVGTFDGAVSEGNGEGGTGNGTVSLTIAANGKISGKVLGSGLTWSLAATSFDATEGPNSEAESPVFYATVIGKAGKEIVTNEVAVTSAVIDGVDVGVASSDDWITYQNLWKRADTKADMPLFKSNIVVDYPLGEPGDLNNTVKLTFKKDGVVSFAGKVGGASVSGSSQLVNDGGGWKVTLYAPAKGTFAGFCRTLAVTLTLDAPNIVKDVTIGGGDAPAGSGSWFAGEFTGYGDAQFPAGGDTEFLNGIFTINVAANLSFTGTFFGTDGTNATFSGTFAKDGSSYVATGVSITVKGKTMSMGLMCEPGPYAGSDEGFGEMWGGSEDVQDEPCIALNCAWQNIWKRTDLAAEWKPAFATGTEKTLDLKDTWLADLSDGDSLTYAFGEKGSVTVTGKIYGETVNATAKLDLEGYDDGTNTMHCNFYFLANGHLYQQQFTFPRQATVAAADITLDSFVRID